MSPFAGKHRARNGDHRPRIGIYESSGALSGPSRYVESILSGIDPNEFEVVLFCRQGGPYRARAGVVLEEVDSDSPTNADRVSASGDVQHRHWPAITPTWLKLWGGFGRESLRLASGFAQKQVNLLHTNSAGCEESAVAARLAGIPRILGTFHVDSTYDLTHRRAGFRHRMLEHVSNHCLDAAIAVSDATARNWINRTHLPRQRVVTIHNGIDPNYFKRNIDQAEARRQLGLPADSLIIGGVGRLEDAKGFSILLDAVALLASQYATLKVALAGHGPLRHSLQDKATNLGIADRVHFLGFCPDVRVVYAALDIFAMPSRCEALPYALLEAMSAELPAVATHVGGISEVIQSGQSGCLIPPQNPSALATALQPLLNSPQLRRQIGRAARQRVIKHFNERDMVAKTLDLYRQMLRRRASRAA